MVSSLKNYIIILYYYFISLYMSRITRTTNWALDWPDDVCFEYKTGEGKKEHGKGNEGKQNCLWSYEEARERTEQNRREKKIILKYQQNSSSQFTRQKKDLIAGTIISLCGGPSFSFYFLLYFIKKKKEEKEA